MHMIKDENGNLLPHGHAHEHSHDHTHEHTHAYSHTHGHGEEHTHEYTHVHEHTHAHGHEEEHIHEHQHSHEHSHDHAHSHGHCHENCGSCNNGCEPKKEAQALLSYMLQHNEHHAAELDQMAANLVKLGLEDSAKQIREAVSDFQKGNMRLSLALTLMKTEMED